MFLAHPFWFAEIPTPSTNKAMTDEKDISMLLHIYQHIQIAQKIRRITLFLIQDLVLRDTTTFLMRSLKRLLQEDTFDGAQGGTLVFHATLALNNSSCSFAKCIHLFV